MNFGNILIIGDSYSTFEGFVPEGYAIYYSSSGGDTDVRKMEETWWHQVISQTDSKIVWLINTEIKEQIGEAIKKACELFGEEYVAFKYIDKIAGHPTVKGMKDIKEQILENLK